MDNLAALITAYKADPESVYNTWFVNSDVRLKAFRSIRRGVQQVVRDIREETFGNDFKGSSLEFVLTCITEQKQVFEGAAHPFYWKPKLRIPDIYENQENKRAFGQFLDACLSAAKAETVLAEMERLAAKNIKGLKPAVASIVYFLHPTILPPVNTAIFNGFNRLFSQKLKQSSWDSYFTLRETVLSANERFRNELSNDLGAFAGLLYEIGSKRFSLDDRASNGELAKAVKVRHKQVTNEKAEEDLHTEMQYHLIKIGRSLGYDVAVASNDRSKQYGDAKFSFLCLSGLPPMNISPETFATVGLIDVLWLEKGTNQVIGAFEVEKSTSIYSGILRLTDLAYSTEKEIKSLFLVAPDKREKEVILQLTRPALQHVAPRIQYILFNKLREDCDAICKYGADHSVMQKLAHSVVKPVPQA